MNITVEKSSDFSLAFNEKASFIRSCPFIGLLVITVYGNYFHLSACDGSFENICKVM